MGCATSSAIAALEARIDMLQSTITLQNGSLKRTLEGLPTTADILRIETLVTPIESEVEEVEEQPPDSEPDEMDCEEEGEKEMPIAYGFTWAWR